MSIWFGIGNVEADSLAGVKGPREEEEPVEKSDIMPPSHVVMLDVVDWVGS